MEPARDWPEREPAGRPARPGAVVRLDEAAGDCYDNLILLCLEHRSAGVRAGAKLGRVKEGHEEWVRRSALAEHSAGSAVRYDPRYRGVTLLPRVSSGLELGSLLEGVHSLQYDRDEPETPAEGELLERFFRYLRGVTELWAAYDPEEKQRAAGHLQDQLDALDRGGLLLFAARYTAEARVAGVPGDWSILRLWILREGPTL